MKIIYYLMITATIISMVGCKKIINNDKGSLTVNISPDESSQLLKTKSSIDPYTFTLEVWRGSTLAASFAPIGAESKTVTLDAASYTISAFSNRFTAPTFDLPIYGETQMTEIKKDENKTITLNCAQTNSGVTIQYSDEFKESHTTYSAIITQPEGHLEYSSSEAKRGYFFAKEAILTILADGNEVDKSLTFAPQTDYDIEIQQTQTGTKGQLSIIINVITEVNKEVIIIDLPNDELAPQPPTGEDIDYYETLGATMTSSTVASYKAWSYPSAVYSGSGVTIKSDTGSDNSGASGSDYLYFISGSKLDISGINTLNESVGNVSLSFGCSKRSGAFSTEEFTVSVSSDGITYTNLQYTRSEDVNWEEVIIDSGIPRTKNLRIRFRCSGSYYSLDDIKLLPQRMVGH